MSMFTITGTVLNTYDAPPRTADTGEILAGKPKVQIVGEMPVPGGQKRIDLVTLTCEDRHMFEPHLGKVVRVPLGIFSPGRGQVVYFIPKGGKPEILGDSA